jgi:hypothetical protein
MRDRSFGLSKRPRPTRLPAPPLADHSIAPGITRQYEPERIDLNDLAQAIRCLLGEGRAAKLVSIQECKFAADSRGRV